MGGVHQLRDNAGSMRDAGPKFKELHFLRPACRAPARFRVFIEQYRIIAA